MRMAVVGASAVKQTLTSFDSHTSCSTATPPSMQCPIRSRALAASHLPPELGSCSLGDDLVLRSMQFEPVKFGLHNPVQRTRPSQTVPHTQLVYSPDLTAGIHWNRLEFVVVGRCGHRGCCTFSCSRLLSDHIQQPYQANNPICTNYNALRGPKLSSSSFYVLT